MTDEWECVTLTEEVLQGRIFSTITVGILGVGRRIEEVLDRICKGSAPSQPTFFQIMA